MRSTAKDFGLDRLSGGVKESLLITLNLRAMETLRPEALIQDEAVVELVSRLDNICLLRIIEALARTFRICRFRLGEAAS